MKRFIAGFLALVLAVAPAFAGGQSAGLPIIGLPVLNGTASQILATDSSTNLTSIAVTGTGSIVRATSPTLVTPLLGTPTSGVLTNATGLPIATGVSGLGTGIATFLATPSSANLISAITDETGTGPLVFATAPTFTSTIQLGTVSTTTGQIKLANSGSANLTTIQAGSAAAARTYTWPTNFGAAGSVLTDAAGDGTLSWAASGGGVTIGTTTITSGTTTKILYDNAGVVGEANVFIGTNLFEFRSGTTAQKVSVYNTFTDASNYERGIFDWVGSANVLSIGTEAAGTGSTRNIRFLVGGADKLNYGVTNVGDWTFAAGSAVRFGSSAFVPSASYFAITSRGVIGAGADGVIIIANNAISDFTRLQLGGTSASFGAIARDGAGIKIVAADGTSVSWLKVPGVTVANLPACSTAGAGALSFVTDASTTLVLGLGGTVTGGGSNKVPVYCDGTNWNYG